MKLYKDFPLLFSLIYCGLGNFILAGSVEAQEITADGTTNTIVNSDDQGNFTIKQGDRAGNNLFHSFAEFSVPTNGSASFNNAADVANILSRVTGGNVSNIDGLIKANGSANLFLINPAGIIFGNGAQLDIGGSFYGSSASSILFEDGEFSVTDIENPPLLTINAPIGLGFRDNPEGGDIVNRSNFGLTDTVIDGVELTLLDSIGLEINPNQTIALIGGNVLLENAAGITAPGGKVELGGLTQAGDITINEDGSLSFPEGIDRGDVTLTGQSRVKVAADGGGSININAKNLELNQQSELYAGIVEDAGSSDAQAGDIKINATDSVRLIGQPRQAPLEIESLTRERDTGTGIRNTVGLSSIIRNDGSSQSNAIGNGGNIKIETKTLELINATVIDTSVFGEGNGGDITINSAEKVIFDQGVLLSQVRGFNLETVKEQGNGDAGNVFINTKSLLLTDQALILADVQEGGTGNGGDITIKASDTFVQNEDSFILTQLGIDNIGSAGNIKIEAGSYEIAERSALPALQSDSQPNAQGNAGNITINVDNTFSLANNLIISQVQSNATGKAGNINISAKNMSIDNFALISTNVKKDSIGSTGNILINVGNLNITDGAVIDALTENNFKGGNISINANQIDLSNGGKIVTSGNSGGDGGSIKLNVTNAIKIDDGKPPIPTPFTEPILQNTAKETGIFASSVEGSTGNGGSIDIQAGSIELLDNGSIAAVTQAGTGGNINLKTTQDITLNRDSSISAEAFNNANGGNVTIDSRFIIAFFNSNSDILADAQRGEGGNIAITTESLLGIEARPLNDLTNDINASSRFNLDGDINVNTSDINPIDDARELPVNRLEADEQVARTCANNQSGTVNNLVINGKGGVPALPTETLNSELIMVNGETVANSQSNDSNDPNNYAFAEHFQGEIATSQGKIIPARGLIKTKAGRIILTATPTTANTSRMPNGLRNCDQQ